MSYYISAVRTFYEYIILLFMFPVVFTTAIILRLTLNLNLNQFNRKNYHAIGCSFVKLLNFKYLAHYYYQYFYCYETSAVVKSFEHTRGLKQGYERLYYY